MTEADVQRALASLSQPRDIAVVPNCTVYGHESDWLRVSEKRVVHEYEVKVSRADFKRDAGKAKWWRQQRVDLSGYTSPNYFAYAAPAGLIAVDELPPGAGLVEVDDRGLVSVAKRPRRRHADPCPDRVLNWVLRGQRSRYEAALSAGDVERVRRHAALQGQHERLVRKHKDDLTRLAAAERRYEELVAAIEAGVDVAALLREVDADPVSAWLGRDHVFRQKVLTAARERRAA